MMQSHGELMQILGDIESVRNRIRTDVLTAGYEARENIRQKGIEALTDIESMLDEMSQSFWDRRK
jgi:hypothetical protein